MKQMNLLLLSLVLLSYISAGETLIWENATKKDFTKGTFQHTMLREDGKVVAGYHLKYFTTKEQSLWSQVWHKKRLYIGTGVNGKIYYRINNTITEYCETKSLIVTALASSGEALFAATIPEGKIFKIKQSEAKCIAKIKSPYIWAMKYYKGKLYIATGPSGTLYTIDTQNYHTTPLVTLKRKHIFSFDIDKEGTIYIGTAPKAILYRFTPGNKITALCDFPGTEIRSICIKGENVFLGINKGKIFNNAQMVRAFSKKIKKQAYRSSLLNRRALLQSALSSSIYIYEKTKGFHKIFELEQNFITNIKKSDTGVFASTGIEGRIYNIQANGQYSIVCDVKEDQILHMLTQNGKLSTFGTGDTGKLYSVVPKKSKRYYYSQIYDTKGFALWGNLYLSKKGKISIQTRTGNTRKTDLYWSNWSYPSFEEKFKIKSPPARYIQYRVCWPNDTGALERVQILYKVHNQKPRINELKLSINNKSTRQLYNEKEKSIKISWKTQDPDGDKLKYQLFYKSITHNCLYEIKRNYTKTYYKWNSFHVPDGLYSITLIVSDELSNSAPLFATKETRPFIIDNHPPILEVQFSNNKLSGKVTDLFSRISQIALRVNTGDWKFISPKDTIFDDTIEHFECILRKKSTDVIEIRAVDERGNAGYSFIR